MAGPKNILLIGRTSGDELPLDKIISENYNVINIISSDNSLTEKNRMALDIIEAFGKIDNELTQVLFVVGESGGRITGKEIKVYKTIRKKIFGNGTKFLNLNKKIDDSDIIKHTTIVRTGFYNFQNPSACNDDRKSLTNKKNNKKIAKVVELCGDGEIVYIYNPLSDGDAYQKAREVSKQKLSEHLREVGNKDAYKSGKLEVIKEIHEKIGQDELKEILEKEKNFFEKFKDKFKKKEEAEKMIDNIKQAAIEIVNYK